MNIYNYEKHTYNFLNDWNQWTKLVNFNELKDLYGFWDQFYYSVYSEVTLKIRMTRIKKE